MPIAKNSATGSGKYIKEAGEHRVKIVETKAGTSKSGKKMLTVVMETPDERQIAGYYCQGTFQMKGLANLKVACGLKEDSPADNLVGKECGILVEAREPDANGRVFMEIVGYGSVKDLSADHAVSSPGDHDDIPF